MCVLCYNRPGWVFGASVKGEASLRMCVGVVMWSWGGDVERGLVKIVGISEKSIN